MSFSGAPFSDTPFSSESGGSGFTLSPAATHVTGVLAVTAVGTGTTWGGGNPFSITSGPATTLTSYVNISATSATFSITVTSLGGAIAISDGTYSASINAAAVAPGVPTSPVLVDNHDGTLTLSYSQPADTGGATITANLGTLSTGQTQAAPSAGADIVFTTAANLVTVSATAHATNSAGPGAESAASNSVTPNNFSVVTLLVRAPYLPTDTMGTKGYQVNEIDSGVFTAVGSHVTSGFVALPNITNGFFVQVTVAPNQSDGSFTGIIVFDGFTDATGNDHRALELTSNRSSNTANVSLCKLAPFASNDTIVQAGYIVYSNNGSVALAHATSPTAIPNVVNGYAFLVTVPADANGGLEAMIVWDTGGSTPSYFDDYVYALPPLATRTGSGGYQTAMRVNL